LYSRHLTRRRIARMDFRRIDSSMFEPPPLRWFSFADLNNAAADSFLNIGLVSPWVFRALSVARYLTCRRLTLPK
jgi:hypothetical protein